MAPSPIDSDVSTFKLGGTLTIPRLGFGAMQLPGRPNRPAVDQAMAVAVARRAVELGVRHLDTAALYVRGGNRANDILWRALHPYPADLTIATRSAPCAPRPARCTARPGPSSSARPSSGTCVNSASTSSTWCICGSDAFENLHRVARRRTATVFQAAIAWGLARSLSTVQIPGTASLAHLEENMAVAHLKLDETDMVLGHR